MSPNKRPFDGADDVIQIYSAILHFNFSNLVTPFSYRPPHRKSMDCNEKNQPQAKIRDRVSSIER